MAKHFNETPAKGVGNSTDEDYGIKTVDVADVCSFSDCTGLLKTGEGKPEEIEKYQEMYSFGGLDQKTQKNHNY